MRTRLFLTFWIGLFLAAMHLPAAAAVPGKRVALVIGNSAYRHAVTLANPMRDAKAIADKLRRLGFVVVEGYDLDHDGMEDAVKDFAKAVQGADLGMFYYAGHGMQVNGKNYFVPVDAAFQDISALDFEAVPMDLVTRQLENDVAVRLVILDACRDNPLSKTLSRSMGGGSRSAAMAEGLAEVKIKDAGEGTAIIFATSPDEVALDGEGDHSPFTTALLDNIGAPDTDLQIVMSRVTGEVLASTRKQQRPWINASLTGSVFLNPRRGPDAASTAEAPPPVVVPSSVAGNQDALQRETMLYNLARESGQREDYQAYLETFPDGLYAANARKQIARIDQTGKEVEVARAEPQPAPAGEVARSVAQPAVELPVTDAVKGMAADAMTEASLELDRLKRAEIQTRLNLAGFTTGTPDGSFGGKTRAAVKAWQASRGLAESGFLNQPQYEILMQQTEQAFASYVPPSRPAAQPPSSRNSTPRREETRRTTQRNQRYTTRRTQRRSGSDEVGRFVGGVLRGVLSR